MVVLWLEVGGHFIASGPGRFVERLHFGALARFFVAVRFDFPGGFDFPGRFAFDGALGLRRLPRLPSSGSASPMREIRS
jgi:hypothetical protein